MWAFAISPHGLGLSSLDFWAMTPRELASHRKVFDHGREFDLSLVAAIQATLHNAHFRHSKSDPVFEPEMFMPDYKPPTKTVGPQWKRDLEHVRKQFETVPDPARIAEAKDALDVMGERAKAARTARSHGATAAEVKAIMNGEIA